MTTLAVADAKGGTLKTTAEKTRSVEARHPAPRMIAFAQAVVRPKRAS